MGSMQAELESACWNVEGHDIQIEYSLPVLNEIRLEVTDGFNRVPHGGVEVGGVLFGAREGNRIRILAHRPLAPEYASGPSFTLSKRDEENLERLFAGAAADPALADLEPVGWYHSHTRSPISLGEKDLELFERFFPAPWQIALVVRPFRFEPSRAGFFFRERDGSIHAGASRHEFTLEPYRGGDAMPRMLGSARTGEPSETRPVAEKRNREEPRPHVAANAPAAPLGLPEEVADSYVPAPFRRRSLQEEEEAQTRRAFAAPAAWILALACLLLAGFAYYRTGLFSSGLDLRVQDAGGQLRIEWNRSAKAVEQAASGWLEIEDGASKFKIFFDSNQIRTGSLTYARQTGNVLVRLKVEGSREGSVEEVTQFLQGTGDNTADVAGLDPAPAAPLQPEPEAANAQPEQAAAAAIEPEKAREKIASPAEPSRSPVAARQPTPTPARPQPARPIRRFDLGTARRSEPPREPKLLPSPETPPERGEATLAASPPPPVRELPYLPLDAKPSPPPSDSVAAATTAAVNARRQATYTGPTSGRLIWTGRLPQDSVLTIEGRKASFGYINGELPGVPLKVTVQPAELTNRGIRIYTGNNQVAARSPESPGPGNGWNPTGYLYSPERAGDLRVVESPSAQNGWRRLAIRGANRPYSVMVLHWEILREN
jgi:proteasome lid subunit RPN8/RPN11